MTKKPDSVTNPTWYGEIRHMFTQEDIDHMQKMEIYLNDYEYVKNHATSIYGQVAAGNMPPGTPWVKGWVQTFLNWMTTGYPKGKPSLKPKLKGVILSSLKGKKAGRVRKEISDLTSTELKKIKKAFSEIMKLEPDDPNSYFLQASWHGLPSQFCMHHIPGYNPWHRAYLYSFENALRSVPGCEDVTLPYWDITTPLPEVLTEAPFASYTLQKSIGNGFEKGYTTTRYSAKKIMTNMKNYEVFTDFDRALSKTDWEDYTGMIGNRPNNTTISGHDGGHVAIGETMANQNISAFDPIFWFYHCNLDRMFWEWQTKIQATDLKTLLTTIQTEQSRQIFTVEPLEALPPFTEGATKLTTVKIIDSINSLDVDYENPKGATEMKMLAATKGSSLASDDFVVHTDRANIRIKGINRLKIPGSFRVHLLRDGNPIATRAFFQPNDAEQCENCVQNAIVHFDFELPLKEVSKGNLGVWVEPTNHSTHGDRFPHKLMGNPTVNVRLLLSNE